MAEDLKRVEMAFTVATIDGYTQYGMTLRDYFAAKVLQGLLSNPTIPSDFNGEDEAAQWAAKVSYLTADAMIEARNK